MIQPILENLPAIASRVAAAREVLIFLDYDGTLTPIVRNHGEARLAPDARDLLTSLSGLRNVTAAIVSGRALEDVRTRVGIAGLVYAGNHGLEISGGGLSFLEPAAASFREPLEILCRNLAARLGHIRGVEVEDKGLSASVHFRRAAPAAEEVVREVVRSLVPANDPRFVLRHGKKTMEVRPRVDWNKGHAVLWIRQQLAAETALSFYIGDDTTDEDAFHALPEAITVKVGDPANTSARYHLAGAGDVIGFLRWLYPVLGGADRK